MFIATDETGILGTLTLAMFRIDRYRAWIEDVIVDDAARGKGWGDSHEAAIAHAFDEGRSPST